MVFMSVFDVKVFSFILLIFNIPVLTDSYANVQFSYRTFCKLAGNLNESRTGESRLCFMWPIQTNLHMYPHGLTWLPAIMLVLWSVMCENSMCQKFEEAKCEEKGGFGSQGI